MEKKVSLMKIFNDYQTQLKWSQIQISLFIENNHTFQTSIRSLMPLIKYISKHCTPHQKIEEVFEIPHDYHQPCFGELMELKGNMFFIKYDNDPELEQKLGLFEEITECFSENITRVLDKNPNQVIKPHFCQKEMMNLDHEIVTIQDKVKLFARSIVEREEELLKDKMMEPCWNIMKKIFEDEYDFISKEENGEKKMECLVPLLCKKQWEAILDCEKKFGGGNEECEIHAKNLFQCAFKKIIEDEIEIVGSRIKD